MGDLTLKTAQETGKLAAKLQKPIKPKQLHLSSVCRAFKILVSEDYVPCLINDPLLDDATVDSIAQRAAHHLRADYGLRNPDIVSQALVGVMEFNYGIPFTAADAKKYAYAFQLPLENVSYWH